MMATSIGLELGPTGGMAAVHRVTQVGHRSRSVAPSSCSVELLRRLGGVGASAAFESAEEQQAEEQAEEQAGVPSTVHRPHSNRSALVFKARCY
mmetsp:Transcript_82405/g.233163  ORF Transcript_82405/g.233163 Transcript_82405/m.233163 type:complete len:94 (+) Transcript_82405:383-664(+)